MEVGVEVAHLDTPEAIPKLPRIIDQNEAAFWTAGRRKLPWDVANPWDFYEQFLTLRPSAWMVLSYNRSEVRVIERFYETNELLTHFPHVSDEGSPYFPILQMWHPNFVDIEKIYLYGDEIFAITEFVGPSLNDLLQRLIEFSETEIAYVVSEVLAGIRFIWSQKLDHPRISVRNIFVSRNGQIKINALDFPVDESHTSADMYSLRALVLSMMREATDAQMPIENRSADIVSFLEATTWATPYGLSDHVFISRCASTPVPSSFYHLPLDMAMPK